MPQERWLQDANNDAATTDDNDSKKDFLDLFIVVMSNLLLFFLIFGLSATVQIKNLKQQLTNKFAIFTGVAMQFLIMPILGFVAVLMLQKTDFTEAMGVTLLVVTASPGGSYSNWWCSLFNAELALSVAMTSVSSILSILLLPLNLFFYTWLAYGVIDSGNEQEEGEDINVLKSLDFGGIFISLGVVMSAIVLGLFCGYKFDNAEFHQRANTFGSICGISLILFSAFLGSGGGSDTETNFWSLPWSFYVGVAFPCLVGMAVANIISRGLKLSCPETVAISIECCYQNTAIATSVAVTMFDDPTERAEAISVPLFYGLVEAFVIGIYCVIVWKMGWTKAPADEKLCVVISKTYEVEPNHGADDDDDEEIDATAAAMERGDVATTPPTKSPGWFARMFEPREEQRRREAAAAGVSSSNGGASTTNGTPQSTNKDASKEEERNRFYSSDVTVSTAAASTPGTPFNNLNSIPRMTIPEEAAPRPQQTNQDNASSSQRQLERTFDATMILDQVETTILNDSIEMKTTRSDESRGSTAISVDMLGQPIERSHIQ